MDGVTNQMNGTQIHVSPDKYRKFFKTFTLYDKEDGLIPVLTFLEPGQTICRVHTVFHHVKIGTIDFHMDVSPNEIESILAALTTEKIGAIYQDQIKAKVAEAEQKLDAANSLKSDGPEQQTSH